MLRDVVELNVRTRLEEQRRELLETIAREDAALATPIEDRSEDTTPSQHPADVASDLAYRQTTIMTALTLKKAVEDIDDALARLAHGTYGLCAECGRTIDAERLAVRPESARCVGCQRREERTRYG